jgi:hypothetical protein
MNGVIVFRKADRYDFDGGVYESGKVIAIIPLSDTEKIRKCGIQFPDAPAEVLNFQ